MAQTSEPQLKRTIKKNQLRQIVPLADSTIWEMEQRGQFPRRFLLTPRCVVWDLGEVEAWLALRRAKPIARATPPDVRKRVSRPVKSSDRNEDRSFLER
jgi:prophage regulatory protein